MRLALVSWHAMWRELGELAGDEGLFNRVVAAYSEPHRHYHTLQHLRECLTLFDEVRALAERPAEVEMALWFHDGVYDVHRQDNEERSAEWAREVLPDRDAGARVHALVMATKGHEARGVDGKLLVDVDLAILGASPERFEESSLQIRQEYAHVPEEEYRSRRSAILKGFLDRPVIYGTPMMRERFEEQARGNISRAILSLRA